MNREDELETALARMISREIDAEIIADLQRMADQEPHPNVTVVIPRQRQLRASWSFEAQEDLRIWLDTGDWVAPAHAQYAKRKKAIKPKPNWKKEGF